MKVMRFTDASEFSRAFKREFGASPSDVRAAVRAGPIPSPPSSPCPFDSRCGSLFALAALVTLAAQGVGDLALQRLLRIAGASAARA